MRNLFPRDVVTLSAFALASTGLIGFIVLAPSLAGPVAVVFPPWVAPGEAMARATAAGALALRQGQYSFIAIVRPSSPTFFARIRRTGAIVVDASGAQGCVGHRASGA